MRVSEDSSIKGSIQSTKIYLKEKSVIWQTSCKKNPEISQNTKVTKTTMKTCKNIWNCFSKICKIICKNKQNECEKCDKLKFTYTLWLWQ